MQIGSNLAFILNKSRKFRYRFLKCFFARYSRRLKKFQGIHRGGTIIIVGNGPSLNKTPLEELKAPSIAMNKINLLFDRTNWRPNYIVCNNGLVMRQNKRFFKSTSIPVILDIKALFMGFYERKFNYFLTGDGNSFSMDFSKEIGGSGTVTYTALQFAVYLGVKTIILVGVDHRFHGFDTAGNERKIEKFKGEDKNHFDASYFKDSYWGVPDLYASEEGYRLAKKSCELLGISIYDATIDGNCDIFDKISFDRAKELINGNNS